MTSSAQQNNWLRGSLAVFWLLSILAFYQFDVQLHTEPSFNFEASRSFQLAEIGGYAGLAALTVLAAWAWRQPARLVEGLAKLTDRVPRFLGWVLILPPLAAYPALVMGYFGIFLENDFPRAWLYSALSIVVALGLSIWKPDRSVVGHFPMGALLLGGGYYLANYAVISTNYPFPYWWTETSRLYYAFTFASPLYGLDLPWPYYDGARHMLMAIPWLIKGLPLWVHRVWNNGLWAGLTILTGVAVAHRLEIKGYAKWLFVLWATLYQAQADSYYQVLLVAILIIWQFDRQRLGRTTAWVLGLALFSGIVRINWIPMAALLATMLWLLEEPYPGKDWRGLFKYLQYPLLWFALSWPLGLAVKNWYQLQSGVDPNLFGYIFSSNMLWYRLLPHASYSLGVFPGVMLATGPALIGVWLAFRRWRSEWDGWRPLGLGLILLGLLAGGLVVSAKIGGGLDLHNMDAYVVAVLVLAGYVFAQAARGRDDQPLQFAPPPWLVALLILIPVGFIAFQAGPLDPQDTPAAHQAIDRIQAYINVLTEDGGEVLFIAQRHLVIFGYIEGVEIAPRWEKVTLIEGAMSNTQTYLDDFAAEMKAQKYALIVSDPLSNRLLDPTDRSKSEENNVYVERIERVMTCYYRPLQTITDGDEVIVLLVPREDVCQD